MKFIFRTVTFGSLFMTTTGMKNGAKKTKKKLNRFVCLFVDDKFIEALVVVKFFLLCFWLTN